MSMKIMKIKAIGNPYPAATGVFLYRYTGQMMGLYLFGKEIFTWEKETDRFYWDSEKKTEVQF